MRQERWGHGKTYSKNHRYHAQWNRCEKWTGDRVKTILRSGCACGILTGCQHWLLTRVCLAAHADVSVVGHLGGLVVGGLILLRDLGVLLRQEGHSLSQVAIAHLRQERREVRLWGSTSEVSKWLIIKSQIVFLDSAHGWLILVQVRTDKKFQSKLNFHQRTL